MDTHELLKQFAREQEVNQKEVYKFIDKITNVRTLSELNRIPKDMLTHYSYTTELEDKLLEDYIGQYVYGRYETKMVGEIVEGLLDDLYIIMRRYDKALQIYDNEQLEKQAIEFDKSNMSENDINEFENLLNIRESIINIKFGSVVWDW